MKKNQTDKIVNWISRNIIWIYLGFIAILFVMPFVFIIQSPFGLIESEKANEIGEAINGLTAPIIGSFSALLVYLAFKAQTDANILNRKKFEFENLLILFESTIKSTDSIVIEDRRISNIDYILTIKSRTNSKSTSGIDSFHNSDQPSTELLKKYLSSDVVENYKRNIEQIIFLLLW